MMNLPPPLPVSQPSAVRSALAILLSLCLGLFVLDAVLSLLDDGLLYFADRATLSLPRGILSGLSLLVSILVYGLMWLTPGIPKRWFLPITLFLPVMILLQLLGLIYFFEKIQLMALVTSCVHLTFALWVLYRLQGGMKFRWSLVRESRLKPARFTWGNFLGFFLLNAFVFLPLLFVYFGFCLTNAVSHSTEGFVTLRSEGVTMQTRKYVREDGKTVLLVPMSHVGEREFYESLTQSFPANAVILTEGVTDLGNLFRPAASASASTASAPPAPRKQKSNYSRMAQVLGVVEQEEAFHPQGELVPADVDMAAFSPSTRSLLKSIFSFHRDGVTPETLSAMMDESSAPSVQKQLWHDILEKRNEHLLGVFHARLPQAETVVIPWGAAHMPGISKAILSAGFHLAEAQDRVAIRYRRPQKVN